MVQLNRNPPSEIQLIKKEIEAQGEFLNQEKLERVTEIDKLHIELEALKSTLSKLVPEFSSRFDETYQELMHNFNPESHRKKAG